MSKSPRRRRTKEHRISVRSVRRQPADYRKLARVLIAFAQADAEARAAADGPTPTNTKPTEAA